MCLCDNIGLVALILLGWELRASSITVLCVQAVMHDLVSFAFYAIPIFHSNSKNFYITCYIVQFPNNEEGDMHIYIINIYSTCIIYNMPCDPKSLSLLLFIQSLYSLSKLQFFSFTCIIEV